MTHRNKHRSILGQQRRRVVKQNPANLLTFFLLFSLTPVMPSHQALGRHPGLNQQSTNQPRDAGNRTSDENDVRILEPGKPIKRDLAGGQQHTYQIRLSTDQLMRMVVEEHGIDVVVQAFGPDGKQIAWFDSESRPGGQESVSLVAEAAGDYRLVVQPKRNVASAASYEIRIEELRAATENEHALQKALKQHEDARNLGRAGRYDEVLPLLESVLETRRRILGTNHRSIAAVLFDLALLNRLKGDYTNAESLYRQALDIQEKVMGPDHPNVAATLREIAVIYDIKGHYKRAEPLFQRALAISEKELGPNHPSVADILDSLAIVYSHQDDYTMAEPLFQRALTIREKALGPEHLNVGNSLNNLALLHADRGDYAKAEEIYQRSLAIREKALGPEHPTVANSLNNLALLHTDRGDYAKAEPLLQRALTIKEKVLGPEHPTVAYSLNDLTEIHLNRGDYVRAELVCKRALAIREKALGLEHPLVTDTLINLAIIYKTRGDYAKAEPLLNRALTIRERVLGGHHSKVAESSNLLAMFYAAKGDIGRAVTFQSRANAVSEHNLALNLTTGSERQKLAYLAILSEQADRTISFHTRYLPDDLTARDLAATIILQRKGRALDAASQNLNALRSRFSIEDQALLDRLTDTRSQLARLVLGGPQKMLPEQYREQIKALEDRAEKYEADISRRSSEFRAQSLPVTLAAVQAAIPPDAALIEFASYRSFNARAAKDGQAYSQPRYVAYVLRQHGEIQWKEFGDAKTIDDAIAALRTALSDPKRRDVKRLARALDEKVMQPLRPLLGDAKQILVSPDGDLNLIPFEALVDEQEQYLIERYSFTYLTSGRDLLRLQVERESKSAPLVIADPIFGARDQLAKADLPQRKPLARMRLRQSVTTGSDLSNIYFAPLMGTELEAKEIKSLFPEADMLLGEEATEASLKRAVAPRILHIATHGFFLEDRPVRIGGTRGLSLIRDNGDLGGLSANVKIENPLLRSGLALAGANRRTGGKDDDGILSALETTGVNLWGTQLVVLSACDTGVGVVRTGEGVYGLRRSLVLAGSETQVMSLWPVRDYATQRLMKAYYAGLKQGQGRGEALRNVKLMTMRRRGTEHPFYWAGFIQSGKWDELSIKR
jgi:CHAT domain-containing protein/Tfp pilus assembly protein PilF